MASVWYVGTADVKIIASAQWTAIGVADNAGDEVWSSANGWSIPNTQLTSAQITWLASQPDFLTNQADGPRSGSAVVPTSSDTSVATKAYVYQKTMANARPVSTDGTSGLPAPTGVGVELVITAGGLQDIRLNGVSL